MLIIVQHGLVEPLLQLALDLEALWSREILELNRAERQLDRHNGLDDTLDLRLLQENRHAVEADEIGEQCGFALHHRQPGERPDISKAEHRRSVRDDRNRIVDAREIPRRTRVVLDSKTDAGHAGGVDIAQDLLGIDGDAGDSTDLSSPVTIEHAVGLAEKTCVRKLPDPLVEASVRGLVHLQRQLPDRPALIAAQGAQMLDCQPRLCDDLEHLRKAAGPVHGLDEEDLRNLHGRRSLRSSTDHPGGQHDRVPPPRGQPIQISRAKATPFARRAKTLARPWAAGDFLQ